jgi:6-phosphogluconolactonase
VHGDVRLVDSVPDAFARLVLDRLAASTPPFSLFLSGGSTAEESYRRLAELSGAEGAPGWGGVDIYLGDERCVPPDDADSNHRMIAHTLLDAVGPVRSDHPMYRSGAPDRAAAEYQEIIAPLARFDLVHLGIGPDGHTASLFPGSAALDIDDPASLVVDNRDPSGRNPHDRLTLTYPAIARARLVVFTVSGSAKAEAFGRVVAGDTLPAARVTADEVVWLVDADAAGGAVPPRGPAS